MATITLDAKTPGGPIDEQWDSYKFNAKLVNPANKRRYEIICFGVGEQAQGEAPFTPLPAGETLDGRSVGLHADLTMVRLFGVARLGDFV